MKFLFIFLICFSANADFAKLSDVESGSVSNFFTKMKKCGSDCIKLPKNYKEEYHILINEMIDDIDKPVNSKNETEACSDQADCEAKNELKSCTDVDEIVIMSEDFSEVYCSKLLRYEQKPSGRKTIVIDNDLKATYMADKKSKSDARKAKRNEVMGDILDKLNSNQALTQIQIKKLFLHLLGK